MSDMQQGLCNDFIHGRGVAFGTAHRGTVLEFGDRRLALSFEMEGADASLMVKHAKFQSRFATGVCVAWEKQKRTNTLLP